MAALRRLPVTEAESPRIEFPVEGILDDEIRLRLWADSDQPATIAAVQDPEIPRWTRVPDDYNERDAAEWSVERQRQQQVGEGLHLVITDVDNGQVLGAIGIHDLDRSERRCNIGYWLAREARGRGVMTRAVTMLSRWAFDNLPVERIEITIDPANTASRAVAERAGYTFEGVLRSHAVIKGRRRDMAMHSLLRGELQ